MLSVTETFAPGAAADAGKVQLFICCFASGQRNAAGHPEADAGQGGILQKFPSIALLLQGWISFEKTWCVSPRADGERSLQYRCIRRSRAVQSKSDFF